jgi:hypothetical protein
MEHIIFETNKGTIDGEHIYNNPPRQNFCRKPIGDSCSHAESHTKPLSYCMALCHDPKSDLLRVLKIQELPTRRSARLQQMVPKI